ncbi:sporulation protein YpjB [Paenibacillus humicola]|uniref:sporulation protein YpjB n=1 Tax=Paenibacillus humicola TaxID=3110540 RepID=UPI00237A4646|nr:sporulation protein YpjB [Paenibacillus humicola]
MRSKRIFVTGLCALLLMLAAAGCSERITRQAAGEDSAADGSAAEADRLYKLTEQFYTAVSDENRQLAYVLAGRIKQAAAQNGVRELGYGGGWKAFDDTVQAAEKTLAKEQAVSDWNLQGAQLKLAADTLVRPNAPVWLQYKDVLDDDLSRLDQVWRSSSAQRVQGSLAALNVLADHAERFEVAAMLQRPAELEQALQKQIAYTKEMLQSASAGGPAVKSMDRTFAQLKASYDRLFEPSPAEAAESKLASIAPMDRLGASHEYLTTMFIAAFVMGILGLAGWQRFVYEKRKGTIVPPRGGRK